MCLTVKFQWIYQAFFQARFLIKTMKNQMYQVKFLCNTLYKSLIIQIYYKPFAILIYFLFSY